MGVLDRQGGLIGTKSLKWRLQAGQTDPGLIESDSTPTFRLGLGSRFGRHKMLAIIASLMTEMRGLSWGLVVSQSVRWIVSRFVLGPFASLVVLCLPAWLSICLCVSYFSSSGCCPNCIVKLITLFSVLYSCCCISGGLCSLRSFLPLVTICPLLFLLMLILKTHESSHLNNYNRNDFTRLELQTGRQTIGT